jgi:hypothetical protein
MIKGGWTDRGFTLYDIRGNKLPSELVSRSIWVTFEKEGYHCYPVAATDPALATGVHDDVSFLAHPHRHIFKFNVKISVNHNDRDIEFIQFKRWLQSLYETGTLELNSKSCEMIAEDLHSQIEAKYPRRTCEITVSEDGENGATLGWAPA